jgi:TPR repeat protein
MRIDPATARRDLTGRNHVAGENGIILGIMATLKRKKSNLEDVVLGGRQLNVIEYLILSLRIGTAGLLAALFLSACSKSNNPAASPPKAKEKIDLNELRAKAERGEAQAQKDLGKVYSKGELIGQSYREAAKWYRLAADQGNAAAQAALGELCEAGQGVKRDEAEAAKWYRKSAEQGYAPAQYSLATLYVLGSGVPADEAEAIKWYRRAADQGDAGSQYNLGMRYKEGKGVKPDPIESFKWLSLAAQSMVDAGKKLDELKRGMTREQLTEGQQRVSAFATKK